MDQFRKELSVMLPVFDLVLTRHWMKLKKKISLSTYLETNGDLLAIVCDTNDVKAVAACDGRWETVHGAVSRPRPPDMKGDLHDIRCFF